jgi:hypothetical protein
MQDPTINALQAEMERMQDPTTNALQAKIERMGRVICMLTNIDKKMMMANPKK